MAHSIENVFETIAEQIQAKGVEVILYYLTGNLMKDILAIRKTMADIFHITGDIHWIALFLPGKRTAMTIHDIGFYTNHKHTPKLIIKRYLYCDLPVYHLHKITAVSRETKSQLLKIIGIKPDKIEIIENPVTQKVEFSPKTFNKSKPVILQIGTGQHKNLIGLVEAVRGINCRIEIVGNPSNELLVKMDEYGIEYNIETNIGNERICEKYRECDIVYFASTVEGFGLIILEGQSIGRPVITSNISPMAEIAADGALLVNPASVKEIRSGIIRLIDDSEYRETLIEKGLVNVKRFQPAEISKKYIEFYFNNFKL
ncbi:MAG: glycosyltransferase [Prevotellaceae bacterium]|jgi:glycosyltransferase involved in cell wall biosynthesis|nr:glycosyltransferase [Prevotellaceae bacterium]